MSTVVVTSSEDYICRLPTDEVIEGARIAYRRYLDLTRKRSQIRGDLKDKSGERKDLLQQAQDAHREFNIYKSELDRRIFDQEVSI